MRQAVVKLGGSTAFDHCLDRWVEALASTRLPIVVVPGGGPFADTVREAQVRIGFSDAAAHKMALLATDQFGLALADLSEKFVPARTFQEIADVLTENRLPVWLPASMSIDALDIPVSWDLTSDSLAAWLARKLDADALLLIKQTRDFSADDDLSTLAGRNVIDACFSSMHAEGIDFYLAGPEDAPSARSMLANGELPGIRIGAPVLARNSG